VQAFDFIEADFAILIVFEFFLMTAEGAERIEKQKLCVSAVNTLLLKIL